MFLGENYKVLYRYVSEYLQAIGDETVFLMTKPEWEGLTTMALQFWLSLCYLEQDFPSKS